MKHRDIWMPDAKMWLVRFWVDDRRQEAIDESLFRARELARKAQSWGVMEDGE